MTCALSFIERYKGGHPRPLPDALLELVDYLTPNEIELCALTGGGSLAGAAGGGGLAGAAGGGGDAGEKGALLTAAAARTRGLLGEGRASRVLVKLGPHGALLVTRDGEQAWSAVAVTAVDTTAAGDAFNAAFAVALLEGKTELEAGAFACAAAAVSVTRRGAQPSMPVRAEVSNAPAVPALPRLA